MDKWFSRSTLKVLSNTLSLFTIVSCTFLKLPQIYAVATMHSAEGLMYQAILLEIISYSVIFAYNYVQRYSILTYMEYPIVLSEDLVLMYLVLKYKGLLSHPLLKPITVLYWIIMYLLVFEGIPKSYLFILVQICTPMASIANATHIYGMVNQNSAQAVSLTTWIISILSNGSRIFTVALDSGDLTLIFNFLGSGTLSIGVLFTALYFQTMMGPKSIIPISPRRRADFQSMNVEVAGIDDFPQLTVDYLIEYTEVLMAVIKDNLQIISDIVSLFTIATLTFYKVPQIYAVVQRASAEGLMVQAILLEIVSYSITMMYNYVNQYSLITYLEYPIILGGNMALLYFVLKYKNMLQNPLVPILTVLYCIVMYCLATDLIPKIFLFVLIQGCTPMSAMAKVTHIYGMVSQQSAETVSLTTWIISFLSNITRIFTVYLDSADPTLLMNFLISGLLSLSVLLTAIFYQSAKRIKDKEIKDK